MKKIALVATLIAAAFATPAFADSYVFADVGSVSMSDAAAYSSPTAFRGGYAWGDNANFKNEISATFMTESKATVGTTTGKMSASSFAYALAGKFPIEKVQGLSLTGRLGLAFNRCALTQTGTNWSYDATAITTQIQYGFGGEYAVNDKLSVRASWESLGKFKADTAATGSTFTMVAGGLNYQF